jgi:hypothetical protein
LRCFWTTTTMRSPVDLFMKVSDGEVEGQESRGSFHCPA